MDIFTIVMLVAAGCVLLAWGPRVLLACIVIPAVLFAAFGAIVIIKAEREDARYEARQALEAKALATFCASPSDGDKPWEHYRRIADCPAPIVGTTRWQTVAPR